jgi:hypothetical protein
MAHVTSRIKLVLTLLPWIGALITLLALLGAGNYPEREQFYATMLHEMNLPAKTSIGIQFMKDFGLSDSDIELADRLTVSGLGTGGLISSGNIHAKAADDTALTICNTDQLRDWAYSKSSLYEWIGFGLVVGGLFMNTVVLPLTRRVQRRDTRC